RVSRYLEIQTEPVPMGRIETDLTGNARYLRIAVTCLLSEGYARETKGPRGARLVLSVKAFRDTTSSTTSSTDDDTTSSDLVQDLVHHDTAQPSGNARPRPTSSDLVQDGGSRPRPSGEDALQGVPGSTDEVEDAEIERLATVSRRAQKGAE